MGETIRNRMSVSPLFWRGMMIVSLLTVLISTTLLMVQNASGAGHGEVIRLTKHFDMVLNGGDTSWCVAGSFQGWNNATTPLNDEGLNGDLLAGDGIYSTIYEIAVADRYEFKAVECGNWGNAYPAENSWFYTSAAEQTVTFTFDTNDRSGNAGTPMYPSQYLVDTLGDDLPMVDWVVVGPWQGWDNTSMTTTMSYEGSGLYRLAYTFVATGTYEAKVTESGEWTQQWGANGRSINASTLSFDTTSPNETIVFLVDAVNGQFTAQTSTSATSNWCTTGSFDGWSAPDIPLYDDGTNGDLIGGDNIFSTDYVIGTADRYEFKAFECGNWGVGYPSQNAWFITSTPSQTVKITFDTNDYSGDAGLMFYPTQNIVNVMGDDLGSSWTAVGPWQGWTNNDPATTLTDLGDSMAVLTYTFDAGSYEAKLTETGDWGEQWGADGRSVDAPTIPFTAQNDGAIATFLLDGLAGRMALTVTEVMTTPPPSIYSAVQHPIQDEIMYFLLPDRYVNGDSSNDTGGIPGSSSEHGFLPTEKGYYHGGDLSGLAMTDTLDYLDGLGVTSLWLTPVFGNDPVAPDSGSFNGIGAGYHGYWIIDYESADPHLGTDQELVNFIDAAHGRGIKVFFDIVTNHTGDIINYAEGSTDYIDKETSPYRDENGVAFDDRDYVYSDTFPVLDPLVSFPYTPELEAGEENIKSPNWLNNMIYYHNRGNSTFAGESDDYGDFFGLDDIFTEHPDVLAGFTDIFTNTIANYNIDGFRIDTVKHVNVEFWQQLIPEVMAYAANNGKPDFFMFGEVFDYSAPGKSYYTTVGTLPSVLDFGIQGYTYGFAINSEATDNLSDFFEQDDYYTDADSNAYQLGNFISNHDIGRFGGFIRDQLGGSPDAEWLARSELGHAVIYFSRGFPIVYYGDEQGFVSDGGDKDAREDMFPSQVAVYNDNDLIGTTATTADDNFDNTHPIYQTLSDYAQVRSGHLALRRGVQVPRYSQDSAGVFAFSRIEWDEQVEYVVAFNNSESAASASFDVFSPNMTFSQIYPIGTVNTITSDGTNQLSVNVPALDLVIYRADNALDTVGLITPQATFSMEDGACLGGNTEVAVTLDDMTQLVEVSFEARINGGDWMHIGTDTNAPYRVFYNVEDLAINAEVEFRATVRDLNDGLTTTSVTGTVCGGDQYVVIHYQRPAGDYGDFSSDDFNDFWGLHLWGGAIHPDEATEWPAPKKFSGFDSYGAYVAIRLVDRSQPVNFIIHKGNDKDTPNDRSFPGSLEEIWLVQGDAGYYTSAAEAIGETLVHYNRPDEDYTDWGLHLWQDGSDSLTTWPTRELPSSYDLFGAVYSITTDVYPTLEVTRGLNFIVHDGMGNQEVQRTYTPTVNYEIWVNSEDDEWYDEEGAATETATIHYHRCLGDYGDYNSNDFNDYWGLHLWAGVVDPPASWQDAKKADGTDEFGVYFTIPLITDTVEFPYILHRGDEKDVPADQFLNVSNTAYEIWIVEGSSDLSAGVQFTDPAIAFSVAEQVCGNTMIGDLEKYQAYWLAEDTIGWDSVIAADTVYLHYAPEGGMTIGEMGIDGSSWITLTANGEIDGTIAEKFPHLAGIAAWEIPADSLSMVPEMLKGQIGVSAFAGGEFVDATGLQIPGVLDDLYTYDGELGVSWDGTTPTINVWAPTAKSVTFHLFDDADPATTSVTSTMTLDPATGVWSITGDSTWNYQYYLFEVEVYVHSTGNVERNIVTDPYSFSLAMNSTRSQIVDLSDPALMPPGWDSLAKPELNAPEDITIYELHVRDFSVNDPLVADEDKGTFKAFTYDNSYGMMHLQALAEAGLSHLHLLPVMDIATIDEDKSTWQETGDLSGFGPASEEQQTAVTAIANQDGFNWGYDPFHFGVPEGSYSTVPTGTTRIYEFREMVQSVNETGLRLVIDVVYNHTAASGQTEKSVLDQIVPGYYHRLNAEGDIERSTCCENTATEHNMMEKLMIDTLITWAVDYKVDAFRFDLMGHHMVRNMEAVQAALQALNESDDGVDGSEIYLYGEGWNFGEVANGARGENATQLNVGGLGIGTFSDRLRDAMRGGGPFDSGEDLKRQGFANGLFYDPNDYNYTYDELDALLGLSDHVRAGLTGNLADYAFTTSNDVYTTSANIDYNGQPTGYTEDPQEIITYISKHDNQTLFDINVYGLPASTSMADRIRTQNVGMSTVMLSQGVPFFHAGSDLLRSKSLDRDSYNSGDWFNKLDFTYESNNFGVGLPVAEKNQESWPTMIPYLEDTSIQPEMADITYSASLYQEWLQVRYSSPLFRLQTADEIMDRLAFHNTGSAQVPGLIVMSLSDAVPDAPDLDPSHEMIVSLINANDEPVSFTVDEFIGLGLILHPVLANSVDSVVQTSSFDLATGTFEVPGRTTAVFVLQQPLANVQVIHLAPFAMGDAPVDVYLNGTAVVTDLVYSESSGYIAVPSGVYFVEVNLAETNTVVLSKTVTLTGDADHTLIAAGGVNGYDLELIELLDDLAQRGDTDAYLRIGHLSPFATPLANTALDILDDLVNVSLLEDATFGFIANYITVDAGTQDFSVFLDSTGERLFDLVPTSLQGGERASIYIAGDGINQTQNAYLATGEAGMLPSIVVVVPPTYDLYLPFVTRVQN